MISIRSEAFKLLCITIVLCCLFHSIDGGKIPKISTKTNGTEITTPDSIKTEVTTIKTPLKRTENKSNEDVDDDTEYDDDHDDDNDADESAEKNAIQPAADTSLSVWGIVKGLWDWIKVDISQSIFGDDGGSTSSSAVGEGRTFGKIRRLQMALIPLMFKFGVLSAMIAFLVVVGLKTLFLVKVLIAINLLAILAKFFTLKTSFGHVEHVVSPTWNWTPYASGGWQSTAPEHVHQPHINKEIHLHIHGAGAVEPNVASYTPYGNAVSAGSSHGWERRNDPYSAYETMALQGGQQNAIVPNDLSDNTGARGNKEQFNVAPTNHRML